MRNPRLEENAIDLAFTPADLAAIEAAIPHEAVVGAGYAEAGLPMLHR